MSEEWTQPARSELLRLRGGEAGWGYRAGTTPGVEPTALACLGLLVSEPDAPPADGHRVLRGAADWLATIQRPDGSLGLSATQPTPGWTTPYALLLWKALATREPECRRAARWLLGIKGRATPRSDDPERIVGHDATLVGWPWVADTHSWLEPTALAILALGRAGLGEHPRVVEGLRLIRDRAVDTGGWNYGNKATFGRGLRPQPAPTGLALLTLAQTPGEPRSPLVDRAIRYLTATLPGVRAARSLGWGLLGLRAWSVEPEEADRWLAEAYRNALGRPDAAPRLAHLLLAAGGRALSLFRREASAAEPSRSLLRSAAMDHTRDLNRRTFLTGAGALVAGGIGAKLLRDRDEAGLRAEVFIARAESYTDDLAATIRAGLAELGFGPARVAGKSVLLKPNLVEPSRAAPQNNTHPAVIRAAAEVFRSWGARDVVVAEGQGHCRDSELVLEQSGLGPVLNEAKVEFVDLNHDEIVLVPNRLGFTSLRRLALPVMLRRADLIVSLPKMKTHHWTGVTLAMKNLFGVMPGVYYGWPKNVLHHAGIAESVVDITATVRPHLAIVDGIVGMEGDGPIMGTPRHAGVLVLGTNLPAVDATAARLMGINPWRVAYLAGASGRLGPIAERHITQRGAALAPLVQPFQLLDHPSFAVLRS